MNRALSICFFVFTLTVLGLSGFVFAEETPMIYAYIGEDVITIKPGADSGLCKQTNICSAPCEAIDPDCKVSSYRSRNHYE